MNAPAAGFDGRVEDFEFTMGSVVGYRGFKLDFLGRLTGVSKTDNVFTPGLNTAECHICSVKKIKTCSCGFYAYFEEGVLGEDERYLLPSHLYGGEVGGIVEGYGKVVIGTKGFRAEKAVLKALFPLEPRTKKTSSKAVASDRPSRFRYLFPSAPAFERLTNGFTVVTSIVLAVALFVVAFTLTGSAFAVGDMTAGWLSALGSGAALTWSFGFLRRVFVADMIPDRGRESDPDYKRLRQLCRHGKVKNEKTKVNDEPAEDDPLLRLAVLYPEAPIFDSLDDALAAFPVSSAEEFKEPLPTPDTDPDFWNRDTTGKLRRRSQPLDTKPSDSLKEIQAKVDKFIADRYDT